MLPADKVRFFADWFYELKGNLLRSEIEQARIPPYRWEKKGASLFTTGNIRRYRELRGAAYRILKQIELNGGHVFYYGARKTRQPGDHDEKQLYREILRESITRIDHVCLKSESRFLMVLDEQRGDTDFRKQIVAESIQLMFGAQRTLAVAIPNNDHGTLKTTEDCCRVDRYISKTVTSSMERLARDFGQRSPELRMTMIEPPIQAESHFFQTLQCADWLCGLIGRIGCYKVLPDQYPELDWTETYFSARLAAIATSSAIRRD